MDQIKINEIYFKYGKPIYNPIIKKIFDDIVSNEKNYSLNEFCFQIKNNVRNHVLV